MSDPAYLEINGRAYAFPSEPVVVVCIDGSEPAYHADAAAAGHMPFLSSMLRRGTELVGDAVMPSFTNPNNVSIATGAAPVIHGITGNYFYDRSQGLEVMMNDEEFLRAPTIFAAFERAGVDVAIVTAKDKLRRLLGAGLKTGPCFSAEKADEASIDGTPVVELVGLPSPPVYSAELSEFVMAAGVAIMRKHRPLITYLSLTDYVQHKFAPGTEEANRFYAMVDSYLGQLDALGAILVVTADHGMNAKTTGDGTARVVYLEEHLDRWLGAGRSRVVLPITDPYTAHHGSLGSFAFVYLEEPLVDVIAERLSGVPGVTEVLSRQDAALRFELPTDRIGDLAIVADRHVALGTSPGQHDLAALDRPLRSHGGLSEQRVPVLVNRRVAVPSGHRLRNFDAYWLALNLAGGPRNDLETASLRARNVRDKGYVTDL